MMEAIHLITGRMAARQILEQHEYRHGNYRLLRDPTPSSIQTLVSKIGILVSLYMYLGSTGSTYWQQVIDQKQLHPSVPIVAVFNPSSGLGTSRDSNIAS